MKEKNHTAGRALNETINTDFEVMSAKTNMNDQRRSKRDGLEFIFSDPE